ncbi:AraC family transcriptional regulator, partial [Mesorhizobium sp. M2C.T.Ca.TU.002.02.1.1]|uniref:AraC family transcriptional regulator n=1 Tax=Mesorhizobium sp. M2C.T.Ca.TU.002.02.1.1 TaxID=2496788 RepID=UPI000FD2642D
MDFAIRHKARHRPHFGKPEKGRARPGATGKQAYELAILLLPNFSQVCLSSIIEPLRLANALSRRELFRWRLVGPSGGLVECAGGIQIGVANDFEAELIAVRSGKVPDAAIVCAGEEVERLCSSTAVSLVRLYAKRGATLFGSKTGTWLLAKAGLLAGARCTIHWSKAVALSERFDDLSVETARFVRDGATVTCSGGFAAFDMMIDTIDKEAGLELAGTVCRYMGAGHAREGACSPAMPASLR